jgi:hypothetical protein
LIRKQKGDDLNTPEQVLFFHDPTVGISNAGELINDTHHTDFNTFPSSNFLKLFKKTTGVGI